MISELSDGQNPMLARPVAGAGEHLDGRVGELDDVLVVMLDRSGEGSQRLARRRCMDAGGGSHGGVAGGRCQRAAQ
jgi:hypothetical protein